MYEQCCECGRYLQGETEFLDQDEAFRINDDDVCEDCAMDYLRKNNRLILKEDKQC